MAARFVPSSSKTLEGRAGLTERPRRLLCSHWASSRPGARSPDSSRWRVCSPASEGRRRRPGSRASGGDAVVSVVRSFRSKGVSAAQQDHEGPCCQGPGSVRPRGRKSHGTAWVPWDWPSPISQCGSRDWAHLGGSVSSLAGLRQSSCVVASSAPSSNVPSPGWHCWRRLDESGLTYLLARSS